MTVSSSVVNGCVALLVVVRKRQPAPERLPDDDMAARTHDRLEGVERAGEAAPDEARAEAHRNVVRLLLELHLRRVLEPEGDEVLEPGRACPLDRDGVELGRDLDPVDATAELAGEQDRRAAASGGDVEDARARVQPEPLTE